MCDVSCHSLSSRWDFMSPHNKRKFLYLNSEHGRTLVAVSLVRRHFPCAQSSYHTVSRTCVCPPYLNRTLLTAICNQSSSSSISRRCHTHHVYISWPNQVCRFSDFSRFSCSSSSLFASITVGLTVNALTASSDWSGRQHTSAVIAAAAFTQTDRQAPASCW